MAEPESAMSPPMEEKDRDEREREEREVPRETSKKDAKRPYKRKHEPKKLAEIQNKYVLMS